MVMGIFSKPAVLNSQLANCRGLNRNGGYGRKSPFLIFLRGYPSGSELADWSMGYRRFFLGKRWPVVCLQKEI